ncbi:uncharacterized protein CTRU02_211966 [Colletotrichum truncatum]|uniref:Uncharacterized protein n=1 Tax=Colletotrichum truncatum TaxID=5467 RepID=A0ACC3YM58_COLTU
MQNNTLESALIIHHSVQNGLPENFCSFAIHIVKGLAPFCGIPNGEHTVSAMLPVGGAEEVKPQGNVVLILSHIHETKVCL